ncbi:MAG: hypothetical protein FWD47_04965 [Treponema sp.]|nr:hypothetical protein [Treponema sp.]
MKTKLSSIIFILSVIIFSSCLGQNRSTFIPIPDSSYYSQFKTIEVDTQKIIETKSGMTAASLPDWLRVYLSGGIEEVEKLDRFNDKYIFIGINEGENFNALNRWGNFFSATHDFPMLAAARIEKRIIQSSFMYPDYEYGEFFEKFIKSAYNNVYPGTIKEDVYWIKLNVDNIIDQDEDFETLLNTPSEVYIFFVLISADKIILQNVINNMMAAAIASVKPTGSQVSSVNRLRQNFFTGF